MFSLYFPRGIAQTSCEHPIVRSQARRFWWGECGVGHSLLTDLPTSSSLGRPWVTLLLMGDVTGTVVTGIGHNPWQRMAFRDAYFQCLEPPGEGERFIQSDDDILVTMRLGNNHIVNVYSSTPARRVPAHILVLLAFEN